MDQRLADIGVDMAGQTAEPGFDGVDGFPGMQVKPRPLTMRSTIRTFSSAAARFSSLTVMVVVR